ncbi:hypothetical protein M2332_001791 [Sphingobium sp. B11D3A]|nr:hypothetical protein [Sphingobium sp. B11D3A]
MCDCSDRHIFYFSPSLSREGLGWVTRASAFLLHCVSVVPLRGSPTPSPSPEGEGLMRLC